MMLLRSGDRCRSKAAHSRPIKRLKSRLRRWARRTRTRCGMCARPTRMPAQSQLTGIMAPGQTIGARAPSAPLGTFVAASD
jgi:hypothetical protein